MALEDLTGTDKFIGNLNSAWPVDDDWVDEGDNHIRGVKNVLKNTFPDTNGAVHWSTSWARFPDGGASAPGISWTNETGTGFARTGSGVMSVAIQGVVGASFQKNAFNQPQFTINGGYSGLIGEYTSAPLVVTCGAGITPGICLYLQGSTAWSMNCASDQRFYLGSNAASGPAALGGWAMILTPSGVVTARSFSQAAVVTVNAREMTGALADVLKLRGVRGLNPETGREEVAIEEVGEVFPELISEAPTGKAVNYMGLAAPLVEAIRELSARVKALEARVAHT